MLSLSAAALSFSGVARPVVQQRSAVARMGVSDLVGASEEISGKVWDPLNLSEKMDEGNLNLVRAAELKHGRVAMLATVGWAWTATGTHFEGMLSPSAGVSFAALAALDPLTAASKVPGAGIWQMIAAIGTVEVYWENKYPSYKCGGNYGVPACTTDPEKFKELQLAELKNGAPPLPLPALPTHLSPSLALPLFGQPPSSPPRSRAPISHLPPHPRRRSPGDDRHHLVRHCRRHPGLRAVLPLLRCSRVYTGCLLRWTRHDARAALCRVEMKAWKINSPSFTSRETAAPTDGPRATQSDTHPLEANRGSRLPLFGGATGLLRSVMPLLSQARHYEARRVTAVCCRWLLVAAAFLSDHHVAPYHAV